MSISSFREDKSEPVDARRHAPLLALGASLSARLRCRAQIGTSAAVRRAECAALCLRKMLDRDTHHNEKETSSKAKYTHKISKKSKKKPKMRRKKRGKRERKKKKRKKKEQKKRSKHNTKWKKNHREGSSQKKGRTLFTTSK